jgi:hypothetical protein
MKLDAPLPEKQCTLPSSRGLAIDERYARLLRVAGPEELL